MKRNRHFKPQVVSTEEKLQDEVQIAIEEIKYLISDKYPKYTEFITGVFEKVSFYIPDIYRITYTIDGSICFESRATPGFFYELYMPHDMYNDNSMVWEELDECTFSLLEVSHLEFRHSRGHINATNFHNQEDKFDKMIRIIKTIVRNPKVVFCNFWFEHYAEELLQESTFSDENIKKAEEAYEFYYKCKQKSSAIMSKYHRGIKNLADELCNEYADKIYKLGYGFVGRLYDVNIITIRTRAKVYYGDKDRYDKFIRELALRIRKFSEKYITEYGNFIIPASDKYKANFDHFHDYAVYLTVCIDGCTFNNYTSMFHTDDPHCFRTCLNNVDSDRRSFRKIIYVKRKGE